MSKVSRMSLGDLEKLARIRLKSRGIEEYSRTELMIAMVGVIENILGKPPVGFRFFCKSFENGQWYGDVLEYGEDGRWFERGRRTYCFKSLESYLESWLHPGRICYKMIRAYLGKESEIKWWTKESRVYVEDRLRSLGFERVGFQFIISLTFFGSKLFLYKRDIKPYIKVLLPERNIKLHEAKIKYLGKGISGKYHLFMITKDQNASEEKNEILKWLERNLKE